MELYCVITILNRKKSGKLCGIYAEHGSQLTMTMLGEGTAKGWHLRELGLEDEPKAVVTGFVDAQNRKLLFRMAKRRMRIDIPGNGIMLAVPVKSVGGGKTLALLSNNDNFSKNKGADPVGAPSMVFHHELIIIILNKGFTDDVMDAARAAGAHGGTVIHAKGTGAAYASKFLGVSIAEEKEMIYIASRSSQKADIMRAVIEKCGPGTPAGAIALSLPVSAAAGLREPVEEEDET